VVRMAVKGNADFYKSVLEPMKSNEVDTFMEANPLIFPHLDPSLQSKERFQLFLQIKNKKKFSSPFQIPKKLETEELFQFGLNESIENLIFFSPENKNYLQAVVEHVKFHQLEYLRGEKKSEYSFIYFYTRNCLTIFDVLKYKIYGFCKDFLSDEIIPLDLITVQPEEREILTEIFMLTRGLYCRLTNRDEKLRRLDDIQFHVE
jgi:hypothetical protein